MSQNLGSTKYDSEELLTEKLDIARFTRVVDNEVEKRDFYRSLGECVMYCPQTVARAGLQVPHQELVTHAEAVLPRHGGGQGH